MSLVDGCGQEKLEMGLDRIECDRRFLKMYFINPYSPQGQHEMIEIPLLRKLYQL